MSLIQIIIPKDFKNVVLTPDNYLIADTNNSINWDIIKFPLPEGSWGIHNIKDKIVTLKKINKKKLPKNEDIGISNNKEYCDCDECKEIRKRRDSIYKNNFYYKILKKIKYIYIR